MKLKLLGLLLVGFGLNATEEVQEKTKMIKTPSSIIRVKMRIQKYNHQPVRLKKSKKLTIHELEITEWVIVKNDTK